MNPRLRIAPSLLAADFAKLGEPFHGGRLARFGLGVRHVFCGILDLQFDPYRIELLDPNGFLSEDCQALCGNIRKAAAHEQALG